MAKAKTSYSIACSKHGTGGKVANTKEVKVSAPTNKKERLHGGCPFCNAERTQQG